MIIRNYINERIAFQPLKTIEMSKSDPNLAIKKLNQQVFIENQQRSINEPCVTDYFFESKNKN